MDCTFWRTGARMFVPPHADFSVILVDCVWNAMAHAQKTDFFFRRNGRVHLNRRGSKFSRLLTAEVCASALVMVVMLDTPRSEAVWRVPATHSIRQFPLRFPSRASLCAITFQLDSTVYGTSPESFFPILSFPRGIVCQSILVVQWPACLFPSVSSFFSETSKTNIKVNRPL
jgi:hypothetical protein